MAKGIDVDGVALVKRFGTEVIGLLTTPARPTDLLNMYWLGL